ncbi:Uncharacterised protein [Cedecea neteri]|uniref:Transcriptional regulator n=2 Tax=Cedecea neteri TaxID=158822 RepID=A0A291E1C5_9ENTR|nr:transcriptional regulator [Cedecea neteri]SQA96687.1 Uncharacterised protein [Cedecea neteri]
MREPKENEFAFTGERKESVQDRLKLLFRGRTLRRVAQDWGLPYSTLNNYFAKGAKPGLDVVESICNVENVSVGWLVTGKGEAQGATGDCSSQLVSQPSSEDTLRSAWTLAFEYMDKAEADALLRIILSGGIRGVIKMAEHESSLEETFMSFTPELKERAIELVEAHVNAKKGASQEHSVDESVDLQADNKKAG